jgi:hypothetical protein
VTTYAGICLLYSGLVGSTLCGLFCSTPSAFENAGGNASVGQKQLVSVANMQISCRSDEHLEGKASKSSGCENIPVVRNFEKFTFWGRW